MKNKLTDLNNHLFEQLERLNDDNLNGDNLEQEIRRCDSMAKIAKTIIDNGHLALNVKKHLDEYGKGDNFVMPAMLENKE